MRHTEKTFRVHFTPLQDRACTLRRKLSAGLLAPSHAAPQLVAILYDDDYTACMVAARTLGEHGGAGAIPALVETVLWCDDEHRYFSRQLRCAAIAALERIGQDDDLAQSALFAARWDPDPTVARLAEAATG